jgi:metallo-beta-lactamase class B
VLGKAGDGTPVYLFDTGVGLLLIDSGGSDWGPMLEQEIRLTGRDPRQVKWLALTHWHDDHSADAPFWKKEGVEIWAPEDDAEKLRADKIPVDRTFRDGDVLVFGGVTLRAIATPGHTRGSACFYCEWAGKKILFGEDFALHAGRNAWMGGKDSKYDQYLSSLEKLCDYRVEGRTVVFDMLLPGHGAIDLEQGMKSVIAARDIVRDMVARRKAGEKIAGVDIYKWQWEHRR